MSKWFEPETIKNEHNDDIHTKCLFCSKLLSVKYQDGCLAVTGGRICNSCERKFKRTSIPLSRYYPTPSRFIKCEQELLKGVKIRIKLKGKRVVTKPIKLTNAGNVKKK